MNHSSLMHRRGSASRRLPIVGSMAVMIVSSLLASGAEPADTLSKPGISMPSSMSAPTVRVFGTLPDGRKASLYTLAVPGGWQATVTDYGAILTGFHVPSGGAADATPVDIVLGFDSLDGYVAKHPYFGAICGRVSNRIAGGAF